MKAETTPNQKLETRLHLLKQQYAKSTLLVSHYLKHFKKAKKTSKKIQNQIALKLELLNYN